MPEEFLQRALGRFGVGLDHGLALLTEVHAVRADLKAGGLTDISNETTVMTRGL
jgi:hypothetical protein